MPTKAEAGVSGQRQWQGFFIPESPKRFERPFKGCWMIGPVSGFKERFGRWYLPMPDTSIQAVLPQPATTR
jgi:hypothetical protein